MTFVSDPDILTDRLPQPYRRVVAVLEEAVMQAVEDHIDRDAAIAKVEDREKGLKRTKLKSDEVVTVDGDLATCAAVIGERIIFGFSDGKVGNVQVLTMPVEKIYQPITSPVYFFNVKSLSIFKGVKPPPLLLICGRMELVVVHAVTLQPVSKPLIIEDGLLSVEASGLQGALLISVSTRRNLQLSVYLMRLPQPEIDLSKIENASAAPWIAQAELVDFVFIKQVTAKLSTMGAGVLWFVDADQVQLSSLDPEVDFDPDDESLLPAIVIPEIKVFPVRDFAPMEFTAIDAAGDDLICGTNTGLVVHYRHSVCMGTLPSHYEDVSACKVLKTDNLVAFSAITLGLDGYVHVYDLTKAEKIIFRGNITYPCRPPTQARIVGVTRSLVLISSGDTARVIDFECGTRLCAIDEFPESLELSNELILHRRRSKYIVDSSTLQDLAPKWPAPIIEVDPLEQELPVEINLEGKFFRHLRKQVVQTIYKAMSEVKKEDERAREMKIRGN
jgi:hypothetical protein